jgi:hypothetical protein
MAAQADVVGIGEQGFVVGAHVQRDRQADRRIDAGAGGVQRQLADRDAHAVGALVAEAEDALAVGDDDDAGLERPVAQDLGDAAAVVDADEHAARALEDVAEALAGKADRRRVDQRHDLVDVVANHAEEQGLVAVVQGGQRDELLQRIGQAAQVCEEARHLLVLGVDVRRQQAAQAQRIALDLGEGGALVAQRIVQQSYPARNGVLLCLHDSIPLGGCNVRRTPGA